jgi:hypothetical protein
MSGESNAFDELWFALPKGAALMLDDLLLYEPGELRQ